MTRHPRASRVFQSWKEVDRGGEYDHSLNRCDDASVVIPIPIRDRTFKNKIGEWKEMVVSVVVVR